MKLILDEMIRRSVAEQLRSRGYDVLAVTEQESLRGLPDLDLLERAVGEQRAVVTYNRDDFIQLDREFRQTGRSHAGIVIVSPQRFPEGRSTAQLIAALEAFIKTGSPYPSFLAWLQ